VVDKLRTVWRNGDPDVVRMLAAGARTTAAAGR